MEVRARAEQLRQIDVFADLEAADLEQLASLFREEVRVAQELIFQHADPADFFYFIVDGEVSIFRDEVGRPMQLQRYVQAGDYFGETGIFDEQPRTSAARTRRSTRLLKISRRDFLGFLEAHPSIAFKLQLASARRHSQNVAAVLEMGIRRDIRIRLDQEVILDLDHRGHRSVILANLSQGGLCIGRAPLSWQEDTSHDLRLLYLGQTLEARCRVCWRQGDAVGLTFVDGDEDLEYRIQKMLRLLLE